MQTANSTAYVITPHKVFLPFKTKVTSNADEIRIDDNALITTPEAVPPLPRAPLINTTTIVMRKAMNKFTNEYLFNIIFKILKP